MESTFIHVSEPVPQILAQCQALRERHKRVLERAHLQHIQRKQEMQACGNQEHSAEATYAQNSQK